MQLITYIAAFAITMGKKGRWMSSYLYDIRALQTLCHGILVTNEDEWVFTMLGRKIEEYTINAGKTELYLPKNLSAGIYMGTFKPDIGGKTKEVKIVYQP